MSAAPEEAQPVGILRISTTYDQVADRLRLAAELEGGGIEVLWVTQRMLRLVIPALAQSMDAAKPKTPKEEVTRSYAELMNRVSAKPVEAVKPQAESVEWLVTTIDIARPKTGKKCLITFHPQQGRAARLEMHPINLRKWMGILWRTTSAAKWNPELWPQDLTETLK